MKKTSSKAYAQNNISRGNVASRIPRYVIGASIGVLSTVVVVWLGTTLFVQSLAPERQATGASNKQEGMANESQDEESWQNRVLVGRLKMCGSYYRSPSGIYFGDSMINGADPDSFEIVGETYYRYFTQSCISKDKNSVFDGLEPISGIDPATVAIEGWYLKDKNGAYYGEPFTLIPGADPATFSASSTNRIASDQSWIYECGKRAMPNRKDAILLGDFYGKSDSAIYHMGQKILGANVQTFNVLFGDGVLQCESRTGGYAIDRDRVYFGGKPIEGADPKSFKLLNRIGHAKDKRAEYAHGVAIRNDFRSCSIDPTDLPGGQNIWNSLIPQVNISASSSLFEFCTTANGEVLIGYKDETEGERKTYKLFSPNKSVLGTTDLICNNGVDTHGTVLHQGIQNLQGTHVKIACEISDACVGRKFYRLDLNALRNDSQDTIMQITDEIYDCGYRG